MIMIWIVSCNVMRVIRVGFRVCIYIYSLLSQAPRQLLEVFGSSAECLLWWDLGDFIRDGSFVRGLACPTFVVE